MDDPIIRELEYAMRVLEVEMDSMRFVGWGKSADRMADVIAGLKRAREIYERSKIPNP